MPIYEIVMSILQIFGLFGIGWLAAKNNYLLEEDLKKWARFIVDWLMPLLIFTSITKNLDIGQAKELWLLPILGFSMMVLGALLGFFLKKGLRTNDPDIIKTFHYFCAVNNFGFLPIIIVKNAFGEATLAKLFIFNLGSQISYWTIGVALLGGDDFRTSIKKIITPSLVAIFIALILVFTGIHNYFPNVFFHITGSAGSIAVPLILIVIGASLFHTQLISDTWDMTYLTFVRLILLPLIFVVILNSLTLPPDAYRIALIIALMPVSVSAAVLTRHFGGSPAFAGTAAVWTTLASILTVPLWLFLLI